MQSIGLYIDYFADVLGAISILIIAAVIVRAAIRGTCNRLRNRQTRS